MAFVADVENTIDELRYLAGGTCEGLAGAASDYPTMFLNLHEFVRVLKSIAEKNPSTLGRSYIKDLLRDIEDATTALNERLAACGIHA